MGQYRKSACCLPVFPLLFHEKMTFEKVDSSRPVSKHDSPPQRSPDLLISRSRSTSPKSRLSGGRFADKYILNIANYRDTCADLNTHLLKADPTNID
ncbi:UNVERIFIED_CONTAM: hypothetical protein FKN15_068120 [Acipenser sinensis]